ncbi:MAG TPA: enoyl-CoA hydratase/isomerase family protein [Terriglobales bacterium]|jgi:cyclohexa-1,5-dienecarbonyl-CoA hydratase
MSGPTSGHRVSLALDAPFAHITLANPPLNVIDIPMMEELATAFGAIESQPEISTIVIRGRGKCFSAGVDVAAHTPGLVSDMLEKFHAVVRAGVSSKKITVAVVHGHCLGGGAELAMVCDLVYSTNDALWGFPEIQLGCYPPVAVTALASLVSPKRAAELILTGKTISGTEAAAIGLATVSVHENELDTIVGECLDRIRVLSPAALVLTKKAVYVWDAMHFDKGLARAEKIYLEELMKTEDAQEGIRAFLEKRQPQWKNR